MLTDNEATTSLADRWEVYWEVMISYVVRISQNITWIPSTWATSKKAFSIRHETIPPGWQPQAVTGPIHFSPWSQSIPWKFKGLSWNAFSREVKNQRDERYCGKRVSYNIQSPEKPCKAKVADVLHKYANTQVFRKLLRNASACITVPHLYSRTFLPLSVVCLLGLKYKPLQEIY